MQTKDMINVIEHFMNGGQVISQQDSNTGVVMVPCPNPRWNFALFDYHIAEKSKQKVKMWQWIMQTPSYYYLTTLFFRNKSEVISNQYTGVPVGPAIWTEIEVEV